MEVPGVPEEMSRYLDLCLETAGRVPDWRSGTSQPFLTPAHTTEFYALRTAYRR